MAKTTESRTKKEAMRADARAKVAKLAELEAEHKRTERRRSVALVVSLFLNLTFIVTIYTILVNTK